MYEQIYNLTSMFFKSLKGNLMYESLISKFKGKRGPKRQLSFEKIVALNIYRFHFKNVDLKNYHKMIKELMSDKVPNLPNYENFMKATNKSAVFILAFMNFLIEMNMAILKTSLCSGSFSILSSVVDRYYFPLFLRYVSTTSNFPPFLL